MPSRALTNSFVASAAVIGGRLTEWRDEKTPGLALRVSPGGTKAWTLRYRTASGQQKRLSLGRFPAVSLADARERALRALADVSGGGDPVAEKAREAIEARAARLRTIEGLAERYFADAEKGRHRPRGRPKRTSTLNLEKHYWTRHVQPHFGPWSIEDVGRADIQTFVNGLADDLAISTAQQVRNLLRQLFSYAVWHELVPANPVQFVDVPRFGSRERVLSDEELARLWRGLGAACGFGQLRVSISEGKSASIDDKEGDGAGILVPAPHSPHSAPVSPLMALALRLCLLTLQRRGEVAGMQTGEIDRRAMTWTIPGERTKNHRTHVVPLSEAALTHIDVALALSAGTAARRVDASTSVFSSPRVPGQPLTAHALSTAMRRTAAALGLRDVRTHDLRRTGATRLTGESIGVSRFIVSRILNHVSDNDGASAVTAVYDRTSYLPQKREALTKWSRLLASLETRGIDEEKKDIELRPLHV